MTPTVNVGFIGAGKMAGALAKGFLSAGLIEIGNAIASDPFKGARTAFTESTGIPTTTDNNAVVEQSHVVFLAVKPDQVGNVLAGISNAFSADKLLVSIAAGVSITTLESHLRAGAKVIRVMPNTPALVGASATGYALGTHATTADGEVAEQLFGTVGIAVEVKEKLLDAVTGLSGSGPAYGYLMIEALSDGGVAAGLPRDIATKLAAQTLFGSAKMVLETGMHPGALKDMVTSPGGTTIEGVHQLEIGGLRATLMNAVRAATDKAKALDLPKN